MPQAASLALCLAGLFGRSWKRCRVTASKAGSEAKVAATDSKDGSSIEAAFPIVDLTDPEAREQAFEYLVKRKELKDELFETNKEFEHLAVVMADPGAAMELNDRRVELEEELEGFKEREAMLADLVVEVQGIRKTLMESGSSLSALKEDVQKAEEEKAAALHQLQSIKDDAAAKDAELEKVNAKISSVKAEIQDAESATEEAQQQVEAAESQLEDLHTTAAQKKQIRDTCTKELLEYKEKVDDVRKQVVDFETSAKKASEELNSLEDEKTSLEASIADTRSLCETYETDKAKLAKFVETLPEKLEAETQHARRLEAEINTIKLKLAPEEAAYNEVCGKRLSMMSELKQLPLQLEYTKSQIKAFTAEMEVLRNDKMALVEELSKLEKKKQTAADVLKDLKEEMPDMLVQRDCLRQQIETLVDNARQTKVDLLAEAKQFRRDWVKTKSIDLSEERRALASTTKDLVETAEIVSASQQKAEVALKRAVEERKKSAAGLAELRKLMEVNLAQMEEQERIMLKSFEQDQRARDHLMKLVANGQKTLKEFDGAEKASNDFSKEVDKKAGVDTATEATTKLLFNLGDIINTALKPK
eukprot:TRINITY_DN28059_c0_g1_i1.p1 TRINITY_DN28059_c0_g1~~TRINITY_DN28059_c0_g1_i1.p1  ORF type:complete len:637 (+),score=193.41 TRINITY_DN28059_c0_g1_i1:143-1912(+)